MKKIEIIISPTGETKIQTTGFTGSQCQQASRSLIDALGETTNRKLTSEYFQSSATQQTQINQRG